VVEREREIRRHIGDFTLFFTGMFPESLRYRRRNPLCLDHFVDYLKAGKESYMIVAQYSWGSYAKVATLFKKLAANFDLCAVGLNFVKEGLDRMPPPTFQRAKRMILEDIF